MGDVCSLGTIAAHETIGGAEASNHSAVNIPPIIVLRKRFEKIGVVSVDVLISVCRGALMYVAKQTVREALIFCSLSIRKAW